MLVNKSTIASVFINLKTTFNKAFEAATAQWQATTMEIPSTTSQNDYAWLANFPKMKEWIGDKTLRALKAFKYTIANKRWEATVVVSRDDIEDDNLGIYGPQAQSAGFSARQLPDELISDLKNNAFAAECYDGQYFYDTDHPVGPDGEQSSVSNKGTAALSCASMAGAVASYGTARTAIMSFFDDEGRPLALIPNILEVPPALEATAKILCENEKLTDNGPNPFRGTATVVVNPRLTSSTAWFLHVTDQPVKPFVYQNRKAPVFVQQTNPDSDDVFMRGEFKFGVEARSNAGYGLWQLSYGSTGTA